MDPIVTGLLIFACLFSAGLLTMGIRTLLPEANLSTETKDTVRLSMGLVATMSGLLIGLLVASAKTSYEVERNGVKQMAAHINVLDQTLTNFGHEAEPVRVILRQAVGGVIAHIWPSSGSAKTAVVPDAIWSEALPQAIQQLVPHDESQRIFKTQATQLALEISRMRWLLYEQTDVALPMFLMVVLVSWISILFLSFGLFAPTNSTVVAALLVSAMSVSGAIFLILELDQPFAGLVQISSQPLMNALSQLGG